MYDEFKDGDRYENHNGNKFTLRKEDDYYDDGQPAIWADYDDGPTEGPFPATAFGGQGGGEVTRIDGE